MPQLFNSLIIIYLLLLISVLYKGQNVLLHLEMCLNEGSLEKGTLRAWFSPSSYRNYGRSCRADLTLLSFIEADCVWTHHG